jgi:NADPH-dependent curcumin reductase CurA
MARAQRRKELREKIMAERNRQIVLAARPEGAPQESNFKLVERPLPPLRAGTFLVRTEFFSVDPYMRIRISDQSYAEPTNIGELMLGGAVGRVVESKHPEYHAGDAVAGEWGWQEYAVSDGKDTRRLEDSLAPISTALGVLGMPGMTAYFGLLEIGRPKEGETVFISGAAGAVGSVVGQVARIKGCRAFGSTGSDEKVAYLTKELRFDGAFNYKEVRDYGAKLEELCPRGLDVYFDNVGGPVSDAAFGSINVGARIVLCGQISQYNNRTMARGPRVLFRLVTQRARAEGFMVHQFAERFPEGLRQMAQLIKEGKIAYRETITDGIENAPKAFIGLFTGQNIGKQLVRVAKG